MAPGPGRLAERDRVSKGSSAPTPRAWKRRANRCGAALWSSWQRIRRCQNKPSPAAAGPQRTCRLAEAGPVSHASARPPHVLVPAPGRLRPRSRPGSGGRRRAAASPPAERSLRAALRGPAETPGQGPSHPLRGVWYAGRLSRRATPFAFVPGSRGPVWTRAAPSGTRPPGAQAVVLACRARARGAGPRARVVSAKPADISPGAPAGPGGPREPRVRASEFGR